MLDGDTFAQERVLAAMRKWEGAELPPMPPQPVVVPLVELDWLYPQKPQLPESVSAVLKKLERIKLTMRDIHLVSGDTWAGGRAIQPHMKVTLLRREELPYYNVSDEVDLGGSTESVPSDPAELVRRARQLLIELVTHEIDEVLYVAGLGPDPHLHY
jgi:hypothetical protein